MHQVSCPVTGQYNSLCASQVESSSVLTSSGVSVRESELQDAQRDSPLHERLQHKEAARRSVVRRLVWR
ncbi:hypothetical protein ACINK0_15590 [Deinococcus sp. VB343]|uniref:hypothetical protein n=1 Tax=Deinococcus sp. VB343 TaxID=3385567 RepID=UPI0039C8EA47